MAEQCKSCGAELFVGQQFCRFCGAPTVPLSGSDVPTQMLPTENRTNAHHTSGQRTATETDPIYTPPTTAQNYYQPPTAMHPHDAQTSALTQRRRSPRRWIVALLVIGFMGCITFAALLIAISMRQSGVREVRIIKPVVPKMEKIQPPPPPGIPGMEGQGDALDEEDADVSDDATTFTKTYALKEGATLSLKNMRGDIKIEGWDEENAEVKIVKRGGSDDERKRARITASNDENQLALATSPMAMTSHVEVDYEIKLPRATKHLEIVSLNSDVELSNMAGSVSLNIQQGEIHLENIGGVVRTQLVKGKTKIAFNDKTLAGREPNNISTVNGEVELSIEQDINADIKAEIVDGEIEADDDFGFEVVKRPIGQHLIGRTGAGGKPIVIKVVNGQIKIKK
ncbi:MAG TPA: hypothetical protein VF666_17180 [Pyrinomonadaceae bacterium]|jgi:hypothetical protein